MRISYRDAKRRAALYGARVVDAWWGIWIGDDGRWAISPNGSYCGVCILAAYMLGESSGDDSPGTDAARIFGESVDWVSGAVLGFDGRRWTGHVKMSEDARRGYLVGKRCRASLLRDPARG